MYLPVKFRCFLSPVKIRIIEVAYDQNMRMIFFFILQAITSGSIPGFVDVVLNFGSSDFTDDNLITQLRSARRNTTFFGDDTWLNLFPDHFVRHDGTTSFFVSDYTEVNV